MTLVTRRAATITLGLGAGALLIPGCSSRAETASVRRPRPDLYHCEGCDGALERTVAGMSSRVRIAGPDEPGERMELRGRVTLPDGTTSAPGVVVYAYHTNAAGLYAGGTRETEWSRRHGRLRGWAITDADGRYAFDTIKPAPYPDRSLPAHIHLTMLEPGKRPYYIDDPVFAGEFGVDAAYIARQEFRGGSGIARLGRRGDGTWLATRDIVLEPHPV